MKNKFTLIYRYFAPSPRALIICASKCEAKRIYHDGIEKWHPTTVYPIFQDINFQVRHFKSRQAPTSLNSQIKIEMLAINFNALFEFKMSKFRMDLKD